MAESLAVGADPDAVARRFAQERAGVEAALERCCAGALDGLPARVAEAIRYSLLGGGKRLRAILLGGAYRACGGTGDPAPLAAAVEIVHAYSLVHDDLPCMDDDDMRRGRPTVHRVYGAPAATAAGLAMVPLAVGCGVRAARGLGLTAPEAAEVVRTLMHASGADGMIGGQLLDLEGEGRALSLPELERIHRLKTGALITASVRLGGLAARAPRPRMSALVRYGQAVGLAFQIADDVLDLTATTHELGKTAGRDVELQKSTYPALLGIDGARARAEALSDDACAALAAAGLLTPELEEIARFAVRLRS